MKNEKIISVLIGLVGAINNNGKTSQTDKIILEAILQINNENDLKKNDEIIKLLRAEKYIISPDCQTCKAPCGNTSDYDMENFYKSSEEVKNIKLEIINKLIKLAMMLDERRIEELPEVIIKAIAYIGYDLDINTYNQVILEIDNEIIKY